MKKAKRHNIYYEYVFILLVMISFALIGGGVQTGLATETEWPADYVIKPWHASVCNPSVCGSKYVFVECENTETGVWLWKKIVHREICAPVKAKCTDSDGGKNYNINGTVFINGKEVASDKCIDIKAPYVNLREYYCVGNTTYSSTLYKCPYSCKDGACVTNQTSNATCTDSDGGKDIYKKGTTIGLRIDGNGAKTTKEDHCSNTASVVEYFCTSDGYVDIAVEGLCPSGYACKDGACIPPSEPCKKSAACSIPSISFVPPTPDNGITLNRNYAYINTTITDGNTHDVSAFIDWNRDLLGYWRFESIIKNLNSAGGYKSYIYTIKDDSSYNHTVSLIEPSSMLFVPGVFGDALRFTNISNSEVIGIKSMPILTPDDNWTVSFWAKIKPAQTNWQGVIDFGNGCIWGIYASHDSKPFLCTETGRTGATSQYFYGSTLAFNNDWKFYTLTRQGHVYSWYINGVFDKSQNKGAGDVTQSTSSTWHIAFSYSLNYNGFIDELRVWKRALSPDEIKALYNVQTSPLYNNFTNLKNGNYAYSVYAVDTAGNLNTAPRTLTISTKP